MSTKVITGKALLSYEHLLTPQAGIGGGGNLSIRFH